MSRRRQPLNILVEFADSTDQLDSASVADAFAGDLQTDDVTRWADRVRSVITLSRKPAVLSEITGNDAKDQVRQRILSTIADLQKELRALEAA